MKMKTIIYTLLANIISYTSYAQEQTEYPLDEFSDKFYGKRIAEKSLENEYPQKGSISIFSKKSNKEIIKFNFEDASHAGHIIYKDFNFDGLNDIAICDGTNSCYDYMSYKIYLEKNNTLLCSPEFTRLAQ